MHGVASTEFVFRFQIRHLLLKGSDKRLILLEHHKSNIFDGRRRVGLAKADDFF